MTDQALLTPVDHFDASAKDALGRVASELAILADAAGRMEAVVSAIASRAGAPEEVREELQQIDHIVQHAEALRTYVSGLSDVAGAISIPIGDALAGVLLGDVKARLSGVAGSTESRGEVELF